MRIIDIIMKLKMQSQNLMRGIHPDYVLIERNDLLKILDAYVEFSEKPIHCNQIGENVEYDTVIQSDI